MEIMNKYGLDVGVHCSLCSLELALAWHAITTEAANWVIGASMGTVTVGCGLCGFKLVEAAGYRAAKCCIGEWYNFNCRCVSIRW
jgi:hypothetical protein